MAADDPFCEHCTAPRALERRQTPRGPRVRDTRLCFPCHVSRSELAGPLAAASSGGSAGHARACPGAPGTGPPALPGRAQGGPGRSHLFCLFLLLFLRPGTQQPTPASEEASRGSRPRAAVKTSPGLAAPSAFLRGPGRASCPYSRGQWACLPGSGSAERVAGVLGPEGPPGGEVGLQGHVDSAPPVGSLTEASGWWGHGL